MNGCVAWFTGLPRSGKSTLAGRVRELLAARDISCVLLDGDAVRDAIVPRLGYDTGARDGFYATLANLAVMIARQGNVVLVPATANRRAYREHARRLAPRFVEVHIDTDAARCASQDPAGLYASSARPQLPGAGVAYEAPPAPDVVAHGGHDDTAARRVVEKIAGATATAPSAT